MNTQTIPLNQLRAHPNNSNVMPEALVDKLASHIQRTGRYPPLIVRPFRDPDFNCPPGANDYYQILDGHHRARALKEAGKDSAECVVWQADDQEALLLLATLNRLQGQDDPRKRAKLLSRLADQHGIKRLTRLLPERVEQIKKYLEFKDHPPTPRPPRPLDQMPVAVFFFLKPEEKSRLDLALRQYEGPREQALMKLIEQVKPASGEPDTAPQPLT